MVSFKYSDIFYNVLEMLLHDINTSVQLWLYSEILSLVLCSTTISSCVRHNIEVHIMIIVLAKKIKIPRNMRFAV